VTEQKCPQTLRCKEKQDHRIGQNRHKSRNRRHLGDPRPHRQHHLLAVGERPDGDGDAANQEELLRRVQLEPSHEGDIGKWGNRNEDPDHVGDVVRTQ